MIPAILALTILDTLLLIVIAAVLINVAEGVTWLKSVLIPWITAINNKLGLPK